MDPKIERQLADVARRLAERQDLIIERDRLIVEAFRSGAPLREIARVAELTHPRILAIVRRADSG